MRQISTDPETIIMDGRGIYSGEVLKKKRGVLGGTQLALIEP